MWVFDLLRRVGFDFFAFLESAFLRRGCEVVLTMFCFLNGLGFGLVVVEALLLADFEPIYRNWDF